MSKIFSVLAVVMLLATWGTSPARADVCGSVPGNLVQNCGFETGDFTGWIIGGNMQNPGINWGVDGVFPNSGNYGAFLGAAGAPITLSQTVAALANGSYQVTFYARQESQDASGANVHAFSVSFDGKVLDSESNVAATDSYVKYSFLTSTGATGNSNVLQFNFQNDDSFFDFDDVSVTAVSSAAPEPASFLLVIPGLGALFVLGRRRKSLRLM
jgi:hypothetical protein